MRSFWIPDDGSPGAYISQPFESLVAVVKMRKRTVVVAAGMGEAEIGMAAAEP